MNLTDDERTVLLIAAAGNPMLAIGRWEVPIRSLVASGLMARDASRADVENYVITEAGRKASAETEAAVDRDWIEARRRWGAGGG
jgi:hypothetical protein